MRALPAESVPFRLNVIGESFRERPEVFDHAREEFADRIDVWGYRESREDYLAVLRASDVVVSTARHEFFGIGVVEAVLAGCIPLLPDRLAYPEVLGAHEHPERRAHLYDGGVEGLVAGLDVLASSPIRSVGELRDDLADRFVWTSVARRLDAALSRLVD